MAGEPPQEYATKLEVQALSAQIEANTVGLKSLQADVVEAKTTLAQILGWLRGGFSKDDGEYQPGLIEQNRRITTIVSRAARIGVWLLSAIAVAASSNALINFVAHFYPTFGGAPK